MAARKAPNRSKTAAPAQPDERTARTVRLSSNLARQIEALGVLRGVGFSDLIEQGMAGWLSDQPEHERVVQFVEGRHPTR